ncbi:MULTISPECIES: MarR family transcriptional regulator [unclassified Exiguobacterium]|uniref:MarR family winged helix-turn-helix transcriptional regulator n=1 Tax=unclassified Exiguobacterium TaxID=2644629 RepID=UPI001BEAA9E7|nr:MULTISPECIES: MarR family transcriptional regulator [unclassified Exiguobacterium]
MTETNTMRAREMMQSFWRVQRVLIRLMHQTAQQNDLTLPQLHGLMMLNEQGAISQKELVQRTKMPKSTLSQSLDGLVEKGLIRRDINPDNRREVVLTIDTSGKRLIEDIEQQEEGAEQQLNQILSRLNEGTYHHMIEAHQQIADGLNEGFTECEGGCRHD